MLTPLYLFGISFEKEVSRTQSISSILQYLTALDRYSGTQKLSQVMVSAFKNDSCYATGSQLNVGKENASMQCEMECFPIYIYFSRAEI